jgi:hypothetical protein
MSAIWQASMSFSNKVRPQVNKLIFLKETCSGGILGEECNLNDEYYFRCSWGLFEILDDIVEALNEHEEEIERLLDEQRRQKETGIETKSQ